MSAAGLLSVRAQWAEGQLREIGVDLNRPSVTRLFIGQLPDAVSKTVPYLFTLCAHAQRVASQAALAAATDGESRPVDSRDLWLELLHENFWRLLLDWPPALGLPDQKAAFVAWRNERNAPELAAYSEALCRDVLRPLAARCLAILGEPTSGSAVHSGVAGDAFSAAAWLSFWRGESDRRPQPSQPASVAAVYRQRLAQVEQAVRALADGMPYPVAAAGGGGWGVGQVLTARGVLTHAAHVVDGRVANYRVQAPTDCFFADAAPLSALLAGQCFADVQQARQGLERAILALDPCLPYVVELSDA